MIALESILGKVEEGWKNIMMRNMLWCVLFFLMCIMGLYVISLGVAGVVGFSVTYTNVALDWAYSRLL